MLNEKIGAKANPELQCPELDVVLRRSIVLLRRSSGQDAKLWQGCRAKSPTSTQLQSSRSLSFLQTPVHVKHRFAFTVLQPLGAGGRNSVVMSKPSHFSRATEGGLAALAKWKSRWADRTLRVTVTPPPRTFAERRSVLQALKQRGPIEVFKAVPVRISGPTYLVAG